MFLTLEVQTSEASHLVTFEGTPDEINLELRGFFGGPWLVNKIILIGSNNEVR